MITVWKLNHYNCTKGLSNPQCCVISNSVAHNETNMTTRYLITSVYSTKPSLFDFVYSDCPRVAVVLCSCTVRSFIEIFYIGLSLFPDNVYALK